MPVSKKCQYALRAVFELAKRQGDSTVRMADIAISQSIPTRFLELILNQLKQAHFVESRRGSSGGYMLARPREELTVGEIIRFIEGPLSPVQCAAGGKSDNCPLHGDCAFFPMWERAQEALSQVYDTTTFGDLVEEDRQRCREDAPDRRA